MSRFAVACVLMSLCATVLSQDFTTVNVGGLRKAIATISESGDRYEIKVSLIPVRCFDPGMNKRISQDKARACATEALLRYVGGSKQQSAILSNVEIIEAGVIDTRFVLVMRVPRTSIQLVEVQGKHSTAKPEDRSASPSPFTAKDDFLETLGVISKALKDDLPMFTDSIENFYEAVSDAEEIGVNRYNSLAKEIREDRWLLSTDRDELLQAVTTEEKRFLKNLGKRVKQVESNNKSND